jgi:hypothetical protein
MNATTHTTMYNLLFVRLLLVENLKAFEMWADICMLDAELVVRGERGMRGCDNVPRQFLKYKSRYDGNRVVKKSVKKPIVCILYTQILHNNYRK